MKLTYFWLGLIFIPPTYGSWKCVLNRWSCMCGQIEIHLNDKKNACCDEGCQAKSSVYATCPNGKIQPFGSYCKSLDECIVKDHLKTSIPYKMSDSEDYLCSNETEFQKVCRGITVTTSTCKKCVSIPMTLWVLNRCI